LGIDVGVANDGHNSSGVFQMIELRWVKRKKSYVDEDGEFPYTENVLQYRHRSIHTPWSDWTDVPVVEDKNE
jgi:hypothetical protein